MFQQHKGNNNNSIAIKGEDGMQSAKNNSPPQQLK
jgi:hypothetical protein